MLPQIILVGLHANGAMSIFVEDLLFSILPDPMIVFSIQYTRFLFFSRRSISSLRQTTHSGNSQDCLTVLNKQRTDEAVSLLVLPIKFSFRWVVLYVHY